MLFPVSSLRSNLCTTENVTFPLSSLARFAKRLFAAGKYIGEAKISHSITHHTISPSLLVSHHAEVIVQKHSFQWLSVVQGNKFEIGEILCPTQYLFPLLSFLQTWIEQLNFLLFPFKLPGETFGKHLRQCSRFYVQRKIPAWSFLTPKVGHL